MARWRGEVVALALGLVAAGFAVTQTGTETQTQTQTQAQARTQTQTQTSVHPERAPASAGRRGVAPPSLAGTEPDGDLHMLDDTFIATPGALRFFDYFLTTLGEGGVTDLGAVRALVADEARRRAPAQVGAVLALFDRYVAYLDDVQQAHTIRPDLPLTDALAVTLTRQRAHFGDDADVLFAEENALAVQLLASSSAWQPRSVP